jgi:hypothetical protein
LKRTATAHGPGARSSDNYTLTLSNLPGPQRPIRMGGQFVDSLHVLPISYFGLFCAIASYNGQVRLTTVVDEACHPATRKLADQWAPAFERIYGEVVKDDGEVTAPRAARPGALPAARIGYACASCAYIGGVESVQVDRSSQMAVRHVLGDCRLAPKRVHDPQVEVGQAAVNHRGGSRACFPLGSCV